MSNVDNNGPVKVTGEERAHPSIRLLARACIELARQQLERERGTDVIPRQPNASQEEAPSVATIQEDDRDV